MENLDRARAIIKITATGLAVDKRATLWAIWMKGASTAPEINLRDGGASGQILCSLSPPLSSSAWGIMALPKPILFTTDLYVEYLAASPQPIHLLVQ